MSDIKAGDLVMVVRPEYCCGVADDIGLIFRVLQVKICGMGCEYCGDEARLLIAEDDHHHGGGYDLRVLKKIPPIAELDESEHKEQLPA